MSMKQKGFTLLELVTTIIVVAIIVAIGVPSYQTLFERNRLKGAAEAADSVLQNARFEAIKRNRTVQVNVTNTDGSTWCLGIKIHPDTPCDCTTAGSCQIDNVSTVVSSTDFPGVVMYDANGTDTPPYVHNTLFRPLRGTSQGQTYAFQSEGGEELGVVIARTGRVRMCIPDDPDGNPGDLVGEYSSC